MTPFDTGLYSLTDLAALKKTSKQNISARVAKLVRDGKLQTHKGANKIVLVSLAEYDIATNETTDFAKASGNATRKGALLEEPLAKTAKTTSDISYGTEQARKMRYEADLREIELKKQRGQIIEITELASAAQRIAEDLVRTLDTIPTRADFFASAVAQNGVNGARKALKDLTHELRKTMSAHLGRLADLALTQEPHTDGHEAPADTSPVPITNITSSTPTPCQ